MYDCKAPLSRFYYPDTRRIINAFIIIIIMKPLFLCWVMMLELMPKSINKLANITASIINVSYSISFLG